jgi:hypothetical protein
LPGLPGPPGPPGPPAAAGPAGAPTTPAAGGGRFARVLRLRLLTRRTRLARDGTLVLRVLNRNGFDVSAAMVVRTVRPLDDGEQLMLGRQTATLAADAVTKVRVPVAGAAHDVLRDYRRLRVHVSLRASAPQGEARRFTGGAWVWPAASR